MKKYHCYSGDFDEKTEKLFREAEFLGQGNNGVVYSLPENKVIKLFVEKKVCRDEGYILFKANGSKFFPRMYAWGKLYIVREKVEGIQLDKYIKRCGINKEIVWNIYELIEEFKRLKFSKIDTRCKDIYVLKNNKVMLIDPKKCYKRSVSYPRHLMKGLLKLQVLDEFLYYIKMIDKKRGIEWEERFKRYWEKEKHKKQKRKENNL